MNELICDFRFAICDFLGFARALAQNQTAPQPTGVSPRIAGERGFLFSSVNPKSAVKMLELNFVAGGNGFLNRKSKIPSLRPIPGTPKSRHRNPKPIRDETIQLLSPFQHAVYNAGSRLA
jgi:hypothetical protein